MVAAVVAAVAGDGDGVWMGWGYGLWMASSLGSLVLRGMNGDTAS